MGELLKKIAVIPIRIYQWTVSPWLGKNCRFEPTCSNYTIEAIREWGLLRGWWYGLKRIAKCHPWGGAGFDPIPKKKPSNNSNK